MQKGRLKRWNDDKGFGFIQPENSKEDIFFHISALQRAERRPLVGDVVYFNVIADETGRRKATEVSIEGVKSVFAARDLAKNEPRHQQRKPGQNDTYRARPYQPRKSANRFSSRMLTVVAVFVVVSAFNKFNVTAWFSDSIASNAEITELPIAEQPSIESRFNCEGKTRCNQMTSCSEAMFYLNNCPGSVTDGDGDGRPCEDQWCGH